MSHKPEKPVAYEEKFCGKKEANGQLDRSFLHFSMKDSVCMCVHTRQEHQDKHPVHGSIADQVNYSPEGKNLLYCWSLKKQQHQSSEECKK